MTREQIIKKYQIDKRQHVAQERIDSVYNGTIYRTFGELSAQVSKFAEKHGVDPDSIRIDTTVEGESHCGAGVYIDLFCQRSLTDDEFNKLVDSFISLETRDADNRKKMQKARNENDKKEYERLKQKYGS